MIIKIDLYLLESTKSIGKALGYVSGKAPFDASKYVCYLGCLIIFMAYAMRLNPFSLFWGVTVGGIWAWLFNKTYELLKEVKDLAEEGRVNMAFIARLFMTSSRMRVMIAALVLIELLLGMAAQELTYFMIGFGYTFVLLAEYLVWHWDPPKKTLKNTVKSFLASKAFRPALSPNK